MTVSIATLAVPAGRCLAAALAVGLAVCLAVAGAWAQTPAAAPSDRRALVMGASVSLAAWLEGGRPTALRINVGRAGFALPC